MWYSPRANCDNDTNVASSVSRRWDATSHTICAVLSGFPSEPTLPQTLRAFASPSESGGVVPGSMHSPYTPPTLRFPQNVEAPL